jgi:peptide chain release factor 1
MLDKLAAIEVRFNEVEQRLADPAAMADMKQFAQLNREYKELKVISEAYHSYKLLMDNIESAKKVLATEKDGQGRVGRTASETA